MSAVECGTLLGSMSRDPTRASAEIPDRLGPYAIVAPLAHGGMGTVFRAADTETGRAVAVKTVRLPHEGVLASMRREIRALARLRHPGIVRILAEGVHDGLPWYAMELVEGVTLRRFASDLGIGRAVAPSGPTPAGFGGPAALARGGTPVSEVAPLGKTLDVRPTLDIKHGPQTETARDNIERESFEPPGAAAGGALSRVLALIHRLCGPLGFLHGEGMVHCDLKPENVLVRPDQQPVLVDFGVMSRFGADDSREALEARRAILGTVAYMAPEQLRGELVDGRADLYSLGCILYELLTGRVPFTGRSPGEVVSAHLDELPLPPSVRVDGVVKELDELVLGLLAKEPAERIGYADDVAARLERMGVAPAGEPAERQSYLYRPRLVGRREELAQLRRKLARLDQGHGLAVALRGESGVGKTRLAMELARHASERGAQVLTGECFPTAGSSEATGPLHALRRPLQSIADLCRHGGERAADRLIGHRAPVLAAYQPAFLSLPWGSGQSAPGDIDGTDAGAAPEQSHLPPDAARDRLFRYLTETLGALAREAPVLLILDDVQWADELSLGFLDYVLRKRRLDKMPLMLLLSYRSDEAGEALLEVVERRQVEVVEVPRLDSGSVRAMVGSMLAIEAPPAGLVRYVEERSEGNPFFAAELLRGAVEEGLLARDASGRWRLTEPRSTDAPRLSALPLPSSLDELVGRRLRRLSPAALELAEAAAVLGREMDGELLEEVAEAPDSRRERSGGSDGFDEALVELIGRQVLIEGVANRLRFAHDRLRDLGYARVGEDRRRVLHAAAAQALARRGDLRHGGTAAALAHHFDRAGEPGRAREHYLTAAAAAAARNAHGEAEKLYRSCLALADVAGPSGARDAIAARLELAVDVLALRGRNREALEELERALVAARTFAARPEEGRCLLAIATVLRTVGPLTDARQNCEQALLVLQEVGDRRGEGAARATLGSVCWQQGSIEEACAAYEAAIAIHREVGDRRRLGETQSNLGSIYWELGRIDEALASYDSALDVLRRIGHRRFEGVTLSNLSCIHWARGELEDARRICEEALVINREVGDRRFESVTLVTLALICVDQGLPGNARALCEEAVAIHVEIGNRADEVWSLVVMAMIERRVRGDFTAARALLDRAEALDRELGSSMDTAFAQCERGHIALATGGDGQPFLDAARALNEAAHLGDASDLGKAIVRLELAVRAHERGERMVRGESVAALTPGLRRWYEEGGTC